MVVSFFFFVGGVRDHFASRLAPPSVLLRTLALQSRRVLTRRLHLVVVIVGDVDQLARPYTRSWHPSRKRRDKVDLLRSKFLLSLRRACVIFFEVVVVGVVALTVPLAGAALLAFPFPNIDAMSFPFEVDYQLGGIYTRCFLKVAMGTRCTSAEGKTRNGFIGPSISVHSLLLRCSPSLFLFYIVTS
jgi:hypothetical protein